MRGSTISTFFRVRFNFMLTWVISDDVTRTKAACKSNPRSKEVQQQQQYIHAHQHAPAPAPACSRTHAHVYTRTPTSMHTFSHTRARARASSDALAAIILFLPTPPKKAWDLLAEVELDRGAPRLLMHGIAALVSALLSEPASEPASVKSEAFFRLQYPTMKRRYESFQFGNGTV